MLALTATLLAATLATAPGPQAPGVRLNLSGGGDYRPGDRVTVEVETGEDGYLVVFRVDGDGYVRVIFPLDPDLDPFVRGDRRYELRGRSDRQSFMADDRGGTGMVFAVLSRGPLDFGEYATDTHWDYERLRLDDPAGDTEAQLLGIARRMSGNDRFEYDVTGYRVWGPGYESERPVVVAGGNYDPYFDPTYACLACGWGHPRGGVNISIGNPYYGGWYDPWYDPWYDRWDRYDRRNHWNGWWGWDPYWGTPWRPITVINTPPRPVVPSPIYGTRSRPRLPGALDAPNGAPRLTDPFPAPRPVATNPQTEGRSRARGGASAPAPSRTPERNVPSRREPTAEPPTRGAQPSRGTSSPPTSPPPTSTPPASERSRSRRPQTEQQLTPVVEPRRVEERPVYRPPVESPRVERRPEPSPSSRPTSSPPPRGAQAPERSVERSAPPPRVERSPERSSPPPSAPRSVERSSPPSSPPSGGGSSSSRSRSRGNN